MSSPYLYTQSYYPSPSPYVESYYNQPTHSPFIPPSPLYPSSPYHPSSPLPVDPTTPNTPRRVRFDDDLWQHQPRPRRPSWHAGMTRPVFPNSMSQSPYLLQPPATPSSSRRHSFGNSSFQFPWPTFSHRSDIASPWFQQQTPPFLIHPFLDADTPRSAFIFDLSSPTFSPVRLVAPGQPVFLTQDELAQPATHPPVTRMRIVCDYIPQWPIELEYDYRSHGAGSPYGEAAMLPITLCDVLVAVHRELHTQITHLDWGRLSLSESTAIGRAYTRRCRGNPVEAAEGVKRVDYLLDRFMFLGLVRDGGDLGYEDFRLLV